MSCVTYSVSAAVPAPQQLKLNTITELQKLMCFISRYYYLIVLSSLILVANNALKWKGLSLRVT